MTTDKPTKNGANLQASKATTPQKSDYEALAKSIIAELKKPVLLLQYLINSLAGIEEYMPEKAISLPRKLIDELVISWLNGEGNPSDELLYFTQSVRSICETNPPEQYYGDLSTMIKGLELFNSSFSLDEDDVKVNSTITELLFKIGALSIRFHSSLTIASA